MKYLFTTIFLLLSLMSLCAMITAPASDVGNRRVITWASDDNPRRRTQIDAFNKLHLDLLLRPDASNNSGEKVITQSLVGVGPDVFDATDITMLTDVATGVGLSRPRPD